MLALANAVLLAAKCDYRIVRDGESFCSRMEEGTKSACLCLLNAGTMRNSSDRGAVVPHPGCERRTPVRHRLMGHSTRNINGAVRRTLPALCGLALLAAAAPAAGAGTLRVTAEGNPDFLDPGLAYSDQSWQILANTGNGLMAFSPRGGKAGGNVIPDLALTAPRITGGGRLYTFRLRSSARFGPPANRRVRPSDIKTSIERLFRLKSRGRSLFRNIRGATRFEQRGTGGISGIRTNNRGRTITFRLIKPDPAFVKVLALPFAFAVPTGTPASDRSLQAPAATGPYRIAEYDPNDQIVLERNPGFRPRGRIAAGRPDRIVVALGVDPARSAALIARGDADYTQSRLSESLLDRAQGAGARVRRWTEGSTYYFFMNVNEKPFTSAKVRRAVNLAINRPALVRFFEGNAIATRQMIPPATTGFRRLRVYPRPKVAQARRLVSQAGARGASVTVWGHTTDPSPAATRYLAQRLQSIGLRPRIVFADKAGMLERIGTRRTGAQIGYARWQQDYPDAGVLLDRLFNGRNLRATDNLNYSYVNDARVNSLIARARRTGSASRRAALYRQIDRRVVNRSYVAPFANSRRNDVVSARVGGYVAHQVYGFLWSRARVPADRSAIAAFEAARDGVDAAPAPASPVASELTAPALRGEGALAAQG